MFPLHNYKKLAPKSHPRSSLFLKYNAANDNYQLMDFYAHLKNAESFQQMENDLPPSLDS